MFIFKFSKFSGIQNIQNHETNENNMLKRPHFKIKNPIKCLTKK